MAKMEYNAPDATLRNVTLRWCHTIAPRAPHKGEKKSDGSVFWTAERWEATVEMTEEQANACVKKGFKALPRKTSDGDEVYRLDLTKNTKRSDGTSAQPFLVLDGETGERVDVELGDGTLVDLELYRGDEKDGYRKARVKRIIVRDLVPHAEGAGSGPIEVGGDVTEA